MWWMSSIERAWREVIRLSPEVRVRIYRHPEWDDFLILKAEEETETALGRCRLSIIDKRVPLFLQKRNL